MSYISYKAMNGVGSVSSYDVLFQFAIQCGQMSFPSLYVLHRFHTENSSMHRFAIMCGIQM